jgi:hypothetical protein
MKYCSQCGAEYQDAVSECADCRSATLVSAEEMRRRGLPLPGERDTRTFVRAGSAEDPLSAERFGQVLEEARIPVFTRPGRSSAVDALTSGVALPWWDLLVPEEHAARAAELLALERTRVEAGADEAARAAEDEEREGELEAAASSKRAP